MCLNAVAPSPPVSRPPDSRENLLTLLADRIRDDLGLPASTTAERSFEGLAGDGRRLAPGEQLASGGGSHRQVTSLAWHPVWDWVAVGTLSECVSCPQLR
jgi:hypothetical protein